MINSPLLIGLAAFVVASACGSGGDHVLKNEPFAHLACNLDDSEIGRLRSQAEEFGRQNGLSQKAVELKPETNEFSLLLYDTV